MLTIMLGHSAASRSLYNSKNTEAEGAESQLVVQENERLKARLRQFEALNARQLELRSPYPPLALLAQLTDIKAQLDGSLEIEQVDFVDTHNQVAQGDTSEGGYVTLTVMTNSTHRSASFVKMLRESKMFADVQMQSALEKISATGEDLRFTVRCTF